MKDFPNANFKVGPRDYWSPKNQTITYNPSQPWKKFYYGVLHELAHALLDHSTYKSDFELLKLESDSWDLALKMGKKYSLPISPDHIQNCLDTYRDWLDRRSTCPNCGTHATQKDSRRYHCFNCRTVWQVSNRRFARPYRRMITSL